MDWTKFFGELSGPLMDAVVLIMSTLVTIAGAKVLSYIKDHVQNTQMKTDLLKTAAVAQASVNALINTMSVEMKKALADGTIDDKELAAMQAGIKVKVVNQLPDIEERLKAHINNSSVYIADVIKEQFEKANKITGV